MRGDASSLPVNELLKTKGLKCAAAKAVVMLAARGALRRRGFTM